MDELKAMEMYRLGKYDKEIAAEIGVCKVTVYNWRHRNGLEANGIGKPQYLRHGACSKDKRLYNLWTTMMHRCYNVKRKKYGNYGGRGIRVCEEWHEPNAFIEWAMMNGYRPGLQIDRIDNEKGYSPENCRWVTPKENSRNKRNTRYLTINGITKCVTEWCETIKISQYTIYSWIKEFGREYAESRLEAVLNGKSA
jgi:transposase-like protein